MEIGGIVKTKCVAGYEKSGQGLVENGAIGVVVEVKEKKYEE